MLKYPSVFWKLKFGEFYNTESDIQKDEFLKSH